MGLICFDHTIEELLPFTKILDASHKNVMKEILKGAHLDSDGGTKMHASIRRALDSVELNLSKEEEAYLICLTDGDSHHDDGKLFELLA